MGRGSWAAVLGAMAGLALVSFVACTARSAEEPPTPTVPATVVPSPTPEDILPAGDPGVTVRNVVLACREKDGDRLRSFVTRTVPEEDIQALFDRGSDVQLLSQTVPRAEAGRASVAVRLRVRRDGEVELVERTWELERGADGVWRFTSVPDCY